MRGSSQVLSRRQMGAQKGLLRGRKGHYYGYICKCLKLFGSGGGCIGGQWRLWFLCFIIFFFTQVVDCKFVMLLRNFFVFFKIMLLRNLGLSILNFCISKTIAMFHNLVQVGILPFCQLRPSMAIKLHIWAMASKITILLNLSTNKYSSQPPPPAY